MFFKVYSILIKSANVRVISSELNWLLYVVKPFGPILKTAWTPSLMDLSCGDFVEVLTTGDHD